MMQRRDDSDIMTAWLATLGWCGTAALMTVEATSIYLPLSIQFCKPKAKAK